MGTCILTMTEEKQTLNPGEFKYKLEYDKVRHDLWVTAVFRLPSSLTKRKNTLYYTEEYFDPQIDEIRLPENSTVEDWYSHENGIVLLPSDSYSVKLLITNVKPEDFAKNVAVLQISQAMRKWQLIGQFWKWSKTETDVKEVRISLSNPEDWNTEKLCDLPEGFVLVNNAKSICCNIKPPPTNVELIHKMILEKTFATKEYSIKNEKNGPTLVTVVNSSRLAADFERDLDASDLTDCEAANVSIIRIIPALDSTEEVTVYTNTKIKRDFPFLVSQDAKTLFDCNHNTDMHVQLFQYLLDSAQNKEQDDRPVLETKSPDVVIATEASEDSDKVVHTTCEPTAATGGIPASATK